MLFEDEAIILGLSKFSDNSCIVIFFAKNQGLCKGLLRKPNVNAGNIAFIVWRARSVGNLGRLKCELIEDITPFILHNNIKLLSINTALLTVLKTMPEHDCKLEVYNALLILIRTLKRDICWYRACIVLELTILKNIGFGLDLNRCTVSNVKEVKFISPRSGKAVSEEVGHQYRDKLFFIPKLFIEAYNLLPTDRIANKDEFVASFKITEYFLNKFFLLPMNIRFMELRRHFLNTLICS